MKIGFFGLLTLILVVLKATGHIDCSWIWVFAPLVAPLGILGMIWVSALLIALLVYAIESRMKTKGDRLRDIHEQLKKRTTGRI